MCCVCVCVCLSRGRLEKTKVETYEYNACVTNTHTHTCDYGLDFSRSFSKLSYLCAVRWRVYFPFMPAPLCLCDLKLPNNRKRKTRMNWMIVWVWVVDVAEDKDVVSQKQHKRHVSQKARQKRKKKVARKKIVERKPKILLCATRQKRHNKHEIWLFTSII